MLNREKLLSHLRDASEKTAMNRILDLAERVLTKHEVVVSDFLDPHHLSLAFDILQGLIDLNFKVQGDITKEPERQRIVLFPDYVEANSVQSTVKVLKISGTKNFSLLKHRDFLGAVLGLGIRREKTGDILVSEDSSFMAVASDLAPYIAANLSSVGSVPVDVVELESDALEHQMEESFKLIKTTVASLRLDAVGSHGFNLSRSQLAEEIKAGKVKLNWKVTMEPAKAVHVGDTISCRGRGRLILQEITGSTKKGRTGILLKRLT